jgi:spore germination cell wall hydrolase CwlJ-like protein
VNRPEGHYCHAILSSAAISALSVWCIRVQVRNPTDGALYYYHPLTGQSSWDRPTALEDAQDAVYESKKKLRRSLV